MKVRLAAAALGALVSATFTQGRLSTRDVDRIYKEACKLDDGGRYQRAIKLLERILEHRHRRDRTRRLLAHCYLNWGERLERQNRHKQANDLYSKSLLIRPDSSYAWAVLARTSEELGDLKQAEKQYRKAIECGNKVDGRIGLARVLHRLGRYDEALDVLDNAAKSGAEPSKLAPLIRKTRAFAAKSRQKRSFDTPRFSVQSGDDDAMFKKHGRKVLSFLRSEHGRMVRHFRFRPREKITVVFHSKTDFAKAKQKVDWNRKQHRGLVHVPLDAWAKHQDDVERALRHGLHHAFFGQKFGSASDWIVEGLALWYTGDRIHDWDKIIPGGKLYGAGRMQFTFLFYPPKKRIPYYRQSLALVQHLIERKGKTVVFQLLERRKYQIDVYEDKALRSVYGKDLAGLIADVEARQGR